MERIDLTNGKFGRLTALRPTRLKDGHWNWLFQCDCGSTCEKPASAVKSGTTRSCGCLAKETMQKQFRTHGHTVDRVRSRAYRSWCTAKRRCCSPKAHAYHRYGGRGITMCEVWLQDFLVFLKDMGECPAGLTLDRIDNDGNYEPGNCRWATQKEQAQNRTANIHTVAGSLAEYARQRGVNYAALWDRIQRGQTMDAAADAMILKQERRRLRLSSVQRIGLSE